MNDRAGRRGVLSIPEVHALAVSDPIQFLLRPHLPAKPFPVRAIYFDKSPDANWLVAWHQDQTIAVQERHDLPGFGPWSVKNGIVHVQPPVELLEQMVTIRIHLDDADKSNGALRVLPGTHCLGRLDSATISRLQTERSEVTCCAAAGDALLMRPLLLHASGRSVSSRHRRVLHIEYSSSELPGGLAWSERA